jgi:methyltransferase (TIGR00027 family)
MSENNLTRDMSLVMKSCLITTEPRAIASINYKKNNNNGLYYDPFAELVLEYLEKKPDIEILNNKPKERSIISLQLRAKVVDIRVEELLAENPKIEQIVILGCGMDSRSFRLDRFLGKKVYEIDLEPTINTREWLISSPKFLEKNIPIYPLVRKSIAIDLLKPNFIEQLESNGYSKNIDTIFIAEGLFMYMEQEDYLSILGILAENSSINSTIVATHINNKFYIDAKNNKGNVASIWKSCLPDNYRDLLCEKGWKIKNIVSQGSITDSFDANWGYLNPPYSPCFIADSNSISKWNSEDKLPLVFSINK